MINPNEYQNYLNFESSECCEIDEFHQESLKHIVLNEDSSFYVQNEYPVKESIENEHKAQYTPRFEDRSIERFGYVCRSISPIGDVTNRFAKNLNRESQSAFLESETAASPSFINQICTKYAIISKIES